MNTLLYFPYANPFVLRQVPLCRLACASNGIAQARCCSTPFHCSTCDSIILNESEGLLLNAKLAVF
jgi:hypothetical protein